MTHDTRFGLPLSLVEALKVDPSPVARTLVDLLEDAPTPAPAPAAFAPTRVRARARTRGQTRVGARTWRSLLAGLSLATAGVQAHAAEPTLAGRWSMAPAQSHFQEAVTGPAPDAATWIVSRDDGRRLAYELIEMRRGAAPVRAAYDVTLGGARSRSSTGGTDLDVTAARNEQGDVVIRAPPVAGLQALIRVRRTGRDTAVLEHAVDGVSGPVEVERISLVRTTAPVIGGQR